MALETANFLHELNADNPLNSDPRSQGAAHLRMIKAAIKASFPQIEDVVSVTHTEVNRLSGVSRNIQGEISKLFDRSIGVSSGNSIPDRAAADGRYAPLAGSSSQVFSVASATANAHAVSRAFGDGRYVRPNIGSSVVNNSMLGSNVVNQRVVSSSAIGRAQLRTSTGSFSANASGSSPSLNPTINLDAYSFFPSISASITSGAGSVSPGELGVVSASGGSADAPRFRAAASATGFEGTQVTLQLRVHWRYITS